MKRKQYFPILIDISKKHVLVVGGGIIAYRKILNLLDFDAQVHCLTSKITCDGISDLVTEKKITLDLCEYKKGDARDFALVFSATGNQSANEIIFADCINYSIPVNVADVPDLCSFIMPAFIKRDNLVVSVSSQGSAPFYTKALKDKISAVLSAEESQIINLAGILRDKMREKNIYQNENLRNKIIDNFLNFDWEDFLAANDFEAAISKVEQLLNN